MPSVSESPEIIRLAESTIAYIIAGVGMAILTQRLIFRALTQTTCIKIKFVPGSCLRESKKTVKKSKIKFASIKKGSIFAIPFAR